MRDPFAGPADWLDHATIGPGDDGSMYIEADDGAVSVDGSFERRTKLRNGQRILVGPYEIFVFEAPKPNDLGLTLELVDPIKEGEDADFRRNVQYGLGKTWLNKRLFSWAAFVVVLAAFLAWPVFNAMSGGESRSAQAKGSLTNQKKIISIVVFPIFFRVMRRELISTGKNEGNRQ